MLRKASFLRMLFAAGTLLVAAVISFRPIPDVLAPNDTGRYVDGQLEACSLPAFAGEELTLPWRAFNLLMRPACMGGEPRVFLFCTAMAMPIALLLFASWNCEGTLLMAGGLLISTIGFEFMTNALRQGVSLVFLFAAFHFERRLVKFGAVVAAMLLHDSNWAFAPLVILLALNAGCSTRKALLLWLIPVLAGASYLFSVRFLSVFGEASASFSFYSQLYTETSSMPFLIYILSPFLLIFSVRLLDRRERPSREEWTTFCYSLLLLTGCMLLFPGITYRFAMTAIALQAWMAMRSSNVSIRSGALISYALVVHFATYALISKNVSAVFHG